MSLRKEGEEKEREGTEGKMKRRLEKGRGRKKRRVNAMNDEGREG